MSVQRSPPRKPSESVSGSSSNPDLSKWGLSTGDQKITLRKRKQPLEPECTCSTEMKEIRSEMNRFGDILEKYVESNSQIMTKLQENITEIKTQITELKSNNKHAISLINNQSIQINEIKSVTSIMDTEQKELKSNIIELEKQCKLSETKLNKLENKIKTVGTENEKNPNTLQLIQNEHIIQEMQERSRRERNFIIKGIPEFDNISEEERIIKLKSKILDITSQMCRDLPEPVSVYRLGKYSPGKNRSIKVCYETSTPVKVHVILLTETWIRSENQAQQLQITNYTHYYNYRTDIRGGGVSAYIHNDLKHNLSESKYIGGNNYLWIQLERYALEIGVIYKPGDTNFKEFLNTYEEQLQQRKRSIIFGDFNIDILTKDKTNKEYKQLLKESGYCLINKITKNYHTRECSTKKSILDHVVTNLKDDHFHMVLFDSSMSDHRQVFLELKKTNPPPLKKLPYEALDYDKLRDMLITYDERLIEDYIEIEAILISTIKECKISKMKVLNPPTKEWINKNIIHEIYQRNKIWQECKQKPTDINKVEEYKEKRRFVRHLIKDTKILYYHKQFSECINKPKQMWRLLNDLAGPQLAQKIPKTFHDNPNCALPMDIKSNINPLCVFDPCSADEVLKIIAKLDSKCSTGGLCTQFKAGPRFDLRAEQNVSMVFNIFIRPPPPWRLI
ncbi:unnamed protein product [Leptosia nina]|uniref:Endonuclease/exonuclease/phosphatase domain-containing protein n=1 Tax=Leptosia nina TaxID=320188 RepID=A0AAV1J3F8_9NEOP